MINFFLPMIPPTITHQEKGISVKNGKPVVYEPQELKIARHKISMHLAKHAPSFPITGAVSLCVKWLFPVTRNHIDGEYKTSRPDTDNLQKLLKDCMTDVGFWKDDAQVVSEHIEKFYADKTGIYISIHERCGDVWI